MAICGVGVISTFLCLSYSDKSFSKKSKQMLFNCNVSEYVCSTVRLLLLICQILILLTKVYCNCVGQTWFLEDWLMDCDRSRMSVMQVANIQQFQIIYHSHLGTHQCQQRQQCREQWKFKQFQSITSNMSIGVCDVSGLLVSVCLYQSNYVILSTVVRPKVRCVFPGSCCVAGLDKFGIQSCYLLLCACFKTFQTVRLFDYPI